MPRRSILSAVERDRLLTISEAKDDLIQHYTLSESDLALVRQHRGAANRMGFAIQLCYLRHPGIALGVGQPPFPPLLSFVADQIGLSVQSWEAYGQREHLIELQTIFGFKLFTTSHYRQMVETLTDLALQIDKGIVLASALIENLHKQQIVLPPMDTIERAIAEAVTRANQRIYAVLTDALSESHRQRLDNLLKLRNDSKFTWLTWLRQSPTRSNSRHMLEHIERLKGWHSLDLPTGIEQRVHQNRLLKIAREGGQMTATDLAKFEPQRRYATLVAQALESIATITDEIIDLRDRILGKLVNAAKSKHQREFQADGKAINEKVRLYWRIGQALLEAKEHDKDPFAAIESVLPWDVFVDSVNEAQQLAQPEEFDFLSYLGASYAMLRRYTPKFLNVLKLRAAPTAQSLLDGINIIRRMNADNTRKVPDEAPTDFIKKRWRKLVFVNDRIDRCFYELCALSELKNALRSGDIWVQGSRQFKDFNAYLVPSEKFAELKLTNALLLAVVIDCEEYLNDRLSRLEQQLETVNRMAADNDLPDAIITASGLKITPLEKAVPDAAQVLINQTVSRLPHIKITELLLEVDEWTDFTRHFTHLKTGDTVKDKT